MTAATTVFRARRVVTMEAGAPDATGVAVSGTTIAAVGSIDDLQAMGETFVDDTFADAVVCPGFIDQHLDPILGATTLVTEVIAPEDWRLPRRTFVAVTSQDDYRYALRNAEGRLADPRSWLISWGYHPLWHGALNRAVLDQINAFRPIAVWHRS